MRLSEVKSKTALDSHSFLPVFLDKKNYKGRKMIITADARGFHALQMGKWKYIDDTPPDGLPHRMQAQVKNFQPQLYDLSVDPAEENNIYEQKPEIVKKMKSELERVRGME